MGGELQPPPTPPTPVPTLVSPLPHLRGSLYLNWPQLPADMVELGVQYSSLFDQFFSLIAITLGPQCGRGVFDF